MEPAPHPLGTTDLSYFWMLFTANHRCKAAPRLLTSVQGMYYRDGDGREVLDGTAGLWYVNAGHCHEEIVDAIMTQAAMLDFAPTFQVGRPLAFHAAEKIAKIIPEGLNRIFLANSDSEAVDTTLKIALAYHRTQGEGQRTCLVGRERGYHGVGFGDISVGGTSPGRKTFSANLLPGVDHLLHTHTPEHNAFSRGQPARSEHLADELEHLVTLRDTSTITAVIVEPLTGSTGVLVPLKGYLQRLHVLCDEHGILLIFDEIITDFGRLGAVTAAKFFGVTPDLLTMAKGINSATVPMGAVTVRQSVHDIIISAGAPGAIELFHGYAYSTHPLAAVAAVATLDLYRSEGLFEHAHSLSPVFGAAAHSVKGAPHVKDIHNLGLMAGIELESHPGAVDARAYEVSLKYLECGVLIRYAGGILALSPPPIIEETRIARVFDTVRTILQEVARNEPTD